MLSERRLILAQEVPGRSEKRGKGKEQVIDAIKTRLRQGKAVVAVKKTGFQPEDDMMETTGKATTTGVVAVATIGDTVSPTAATGLAESHDITTATAIVATATTGSIMRSVKTPGALNP